METLSKLSYLYCDAYIYYNYNFYNYILHFLYTYIYKYESTVHTWIYFDIRKKNRLLFP